MTPRRAWTDYHPEYRAPQMRELAGWIAAGQSGSVVGMGGAGKSNLLGFLANRPDALQPYLPEDVRAFVVLVDLNSLPAFDLATVYRLLLRSFHDARGQLEPPLVTEIEQLFSAQLAQRDPFVVQTALLGWLRQLTESGLQVAVVMDRFDRFAEHVRPELTDSLRALRDAFKGRLCYLVGMRQPTAYLPDPTLLGELQELLDTRVCWVGAMEEMDARRMGAEETSRAQPPPSKAEVSMMLRMAGAYPALLKAVCHWWIDAGFGVQSPDWQQTLAPLPAIRSRLDEIWQGLTQAEQAALRVLVSSPKAKRPPGQDAAEHAEALALLEAKGLLAPAGDSALAPKGELLRGYAASKAGSGHGRLRLDPETDEVLLGGKALRELTNLERGALRYLLDRPRQRVPKTELIEGVWPDDVVEGGIMDDALYQVVRGLRRKIEPEPGKPRYLVTWRGRPEGGYQLFPEGRPG